MSKFYALVVVDSYSRWPEVHFTTHPTAQFTQQAQRKLFSREGVPMVLIIDNGTHFNSKEFEEWLNGIGCRHLFTAPRHPQSNGLAKIFVRTLKSAINSLSPNSLTELEIGVDNFPTQYLNSSHSTMHKSPAQLFKSRTLRSSLKCIDSAEVTYFKGHGLKPIVLSKIGKQMLNILDFNDQPKHRRHIDQVRFHYNQFNFENTNESVSSESISDPIPLKNDNVVSENNFHRRSERIKNMPAKNYKHLEFNSRCLKCDIHTDFCYYVLCIF